jgi:hypothetical protein
LRGNMGPVTPCPTLFFSHHLSLSTIPVTCLLLLSPLSLH